MHGRSVYQYWRSTKTEVFVVLVQARYADSKVYTG